MDGCLRETEVMGEVARDCFLTAEGATCLS